MSNSADKPRLFNKLIVSHLIVAAIGGLLLVIALAVNVHLSTRMVEMTRALEPQDQASARLVIGVNQSLAALRGWVSLGDPGFSKQWEDAWQGKIEPAFEELDKLSLEYPNLESKEVLKQLKPLLNDLDESQWWVLGVAQTPGNEPARVFYEQRVLPSADIVDRLIRDFEEVVLETNSSAFTKVVQAARRDFDQLLWSVNDILNQGGEDWGRDFKAFAGALTEDVQQIRRLGEANKRLDVLEFESAALIGLSEQAINLRLSPGWDRAQELMEAETVPLADRVIGLVGELAARASERVSEYGYQTERLITITNIAMVLAIILVIATAFYVARTRSYDIAQPILKLEAAARAFRDDKLNREVAVDGVQEIESLSASFNEMRIHLQSSRELLLEAKEQLEQRVQARTKELALANHMLDRVHDAAYLADQSGRFHFVNNEACNMLGYSREQLLTLRVIDVDNDTASEEDWAVAWKTIRQQGSAVFESAHNTSSGEHIPVEVSATSLEFEENEYIVGLVRDLTERKRVEDALSSQEHFISAIADTSPAMIYVYDLESESNVYSNSGVERLLGFTQEDVKAMGENILAKLVHPDDFPKVLKNHLKIIAASDDDVLSIEYRIKNRNGNWKYMHSEERVFARDSDGAVSQKIGIAVDITERKRSELKLLQAAAVFSSTAEGIAITDTNGNILDVNQSFCEITGYSRDEVIGKNPRILQSGRHGKEYYKAMWKSLREGGSWRGEIWNRNKNGEEYPELLSINVVKNSRGEVTGYVAAFSDISMLKQSENRLEYLAHHDALTGLPNRILFNERLKQSINRSQRRQSSLAVVFIDLDHFKNVNDSLSHQYGDELLRQVSARLSRSIRLEDTLSRLSGDEFVVLLEEIPSVDDATTVVEKMMSVFEETFDVMGTDIRMTCSMGISVFPDDGDESSELLRNADTAMYRAKEDGRNTYQFYSEEMTTVALEHVVFESALRNAIAHDEFFLVFQPKYRLDQFRMNGMEALLRWQHPDLGLIPPSRFIPIAEHSGQIREIGGWVLRKVCEQGKKWLDNGYEFDHIAVNVSSQQMQSDSFLKLFKQVTEETGMPARKLEIEVTETFLMKSTENAISILTRFQNLGVRVSIDDFGTGYSSMAYLKRLPVTSLKIDQSFVRDIPGDSDDVEITKAIIAMAKAMNLEVVAEGIENQSQLDLLKDIGCTYGQGYFLSLPLSSGEVATRLGE